MKRFCFRYYNIRLKEKVCKIKKFFSVIYFRHINRQFLQTWHANIRPSHYRTSVGTWRATSGKHRPYYSVATIRRGTPRPYILPPHCTAATIRHSTPRPYIVGYFYSILGMGCLQTGVDRTSYLRPGIESSLSYSSIDDRSSSVIMVTSSFGSSTLMALP